MRREGLPSRLLGIELDELTPTIREAVWVGAVLVCLAL